VWSVREKGEIKSFDGFLRALPIYYTPIVTRDDTWKGIKTRITTLIKDNEILKDSTPETDKVMICGNMDFNLEIQDILIKRGWVEGSNRENGSFLLEKAFIG
jgi:ferredoxin--NADP+ reductase